MDELAVLLRTMPSSPTFKYICPARTGELCGGQKDGEIEEV